MPSSKTLWATLFLSAVFLIGAFAETRFRDELYYLLAMTSLSLVPLIFLRPRGLDALTFILLTPTMLFSIESLTLRLGYYNILFYLEGDGWPVQLTEDAVRKAAAIVLLGHVLLWAGFAAPISRKVAEELTRYLRPFIADERVRPKMSRVMAVFVAGIVLRVYMVVTGINGYFVDATRREQASSYVQYLIIFESFATLSLLVVVYVEARSDRPRWTFVSTLIGIEVLSLLLEGFKAPIGYLILYVGIVIAMVRRRFPPWLLPMGFLAIWVIYPLVESARRAKGEGKLQTGNLSSIVGAMNDGMVDHFRATDDGESINERIIRTSAQLEPLAMVIQYVDETGTCWYGSDYLFPVISFIPRAVWPNKPSAHHGQWVTSVVYGYEGESSQTTTVPGNFYLNYGMAGVVIGFLFFGALGRVAVVVIGESRSLRFVPLIPFVVHSIGMPQGDLGPHFAGLIQTTIIHLLVLRFLTTTAGGLAPATSLGIQCPRPRG